MLPLVRYVQQMALLLPPTTLKHHRGGPFKNETKYELFFTTITDRFYFLKLI